MALDRLAGIAERLGSLGVEIPAQRSERRRGLQFNRREAALDRILTLRLLKEQDKQEKSARKRQVLTTIAAILTGSLLGPGEAVATGLSDPIGAAATAGGQKAGLTALDSMISGAISPTVTATAAGGGLGAFFNKLVGGVKDIAQVGVEQITALPNLVGSLFGGQQAGQPAGQQPAVAPNFGRRNPAILNEFDNNLSGAPLEIFDRNAGIGVGRDRFGARPDTLQLDEILRQLESQNTPRLATPSIFKNQTLSKEDAELLQRYLESL